MIHLLLVVGLLVPVRPVSSFTYQCAPAPALSCTFTSTSVASKYAWRWGNGRAESHRIATARNTWLKKGTYLVQLIVSDATGRADTSAQSVTLPAYTVFDTTRVVVTSPPIHDTTIVRLPPPPPVHDTMIVRLPPVHDTMIVRLPPVHDTTIVRSPPVHDTTIIRLPGRVDTVFVPQSTVGVRVAHGPTTWLDTHYSAPSGHVYHVAQGQNLQARIDSAAPGDVILLQAGATFQGPFTLRPKRGSAVIVIRSDAPDAALPPEGTRISPRNAALLPKLVAGASNNLVITTTPRAANYRLMFLEVAPMPGADLNTLVRLGSGNTDQPVLDSMPSNIILDRVYLHGTPTTNLVRAVQIHGAGLAVVDSYLSEVHANGQDSQAIVGWNGPGPYKITNNFLSAAGENVMFGGSDPLIAGMVASDIEMRRNHVWKDPAWKGSQWSVKNHLEFKVGQRALIEGNVFENNWVAAQTGLSVLIKSTNQSGGFRAAVSRDVVFRNNIVRNVVSGITIAARPDGPALPANLVTVTNNLFDQLSGGIGIRLNADVRNIVFQRNTLVFSPSGGQTTVQFDRSTGPGSDSVAFLGNVLAKGTFGVLGLDGGGGEGAASLKTYHATFTGNVMNGVAAPQYPGGNSYPSSLTLVYPGLQSMTYTLANGLQNVGVDIAAVQAATAGVVVP